MKGKNTIEVNPKIQAEETMSPTQKRKDTNLKKKYDDSDMKQNMIDQYGEEEGMKVYYATIRKQAMKKKKKIKEDESVLEVQNVSDGIKFREYEFIDVIKNEPMKSPKNDITWTEEKMPVKGLVKLAATVAANNKKRKNALQIQKYIGEDAKTGRMSDDDLSAAHKKISGMDQSMPSNQHMLKRINKEINRRNKPNPKPEVKNEETIVEKQGGDKKKPDTKINYRTTFTQDRVLNSTPEEERAAAKRMSTAERIRQQKRDEIDKKKAKKNEN